MEYIFSLEFIYLIASITYILGLKMLGHPETARRGNLIAAGGMTLAILGTIFLYQGEVPMFIYLMIGIAIVIGTVIGWLIAKKVQMTKMPELVSLFNGMGGASAALIGLIEYHHYTGQTLSIITILGGVIIGSISFSGSMIAWAKLNGTLNKPIRLPKYNMLNNLIFLAIILFATYMAWSSGSSWWLPLWKYGHVNWGNLSWIRWYNIDFCYVHGYESIIGERNIWRLWRYRFHFR